MKPKVRIAAIILALILAYPSGAAAQAYPDRRLTPGAVLTVPLSVLCKPGYTKVVRDVSVATKRRICRAYGITKGCPGPAWEVDHLVNLGISGANSDANLWIQPIREARVKDADEDRLRREVCSGRKRLEDAQAEMLKKWGPR